MSIDYDACAGIGVKVTEEMIEKFIKFRFFTKEDWDDDAPGCLECLNLIYGTAGSYYSGNVWYYLFVEGDNLREINKNLDKFIKVFNTVGIDLKEEDLEVIEDLLKF